LLKSSGTAVLTKVTTHGSVMNGTLALPVRNPICPYCGKPAELVSEEEWYGRVYDNLGRPRWACRSCDASVGTHPDGSPLGSLANRELRQARMDAKDHLQQLFPNRKELYAWLSQQMGLSRRQCHVGMFNLEQCRRVVELCREENLKRDSH
jgi:hypothetical protein